MESIDELKSQAPPGVDYMVFPGAILWRFNQMGHNYYNDHESHLGDNPPVPLGDPAFNCEIPYISCDRDLNSDEWINARKVRRALSISIDRQKLVNNLAFGEGEPWYVNYWTKAQIDKWGLSDWTIPYDVEMAKQLLAEAGYADGFELDMIVTDRPPGSDVVGQAVATMWQGIGVDVKIERLPYVAYRPTLVNRTATQYHSYNNTPSTPEPLNFYGVFHSTSNGFNFGTQHPELGSPAGRGCQDPRRIGAVRSANRNSQVAIRPGVGHSSLRREHGLASFAEVGPMGGWSGDYRLAGQLGGCATPVILW